MEDSEGKCASWNEFVEWRSMWRILKCWLEPGPVFVLEEFEDEAGL